MLTGKSLRPFASACIVGGLVCGIVGGGLVDRARAQAIDIAALPGIVVDEAAAAFEGQWKPSTHTAPYLGQGYHHDDNAERGAKSATFKARVPEDGYYHVLFSYTPGSGRSSKTPVTVHAVDGEKTTVVNQRDRPAILTFVDLGEYEFHTDADAVIVVSNKDADGHVIVDGVLLANPVELAMLQELADKKKPAVVKNQPADKKPMAKDPLPAAVAFARKEPVAKTLLTSAKLDALIAKNNPPMQSVAVVDDETFLRRVTLDIVGRQPTVEELQAFHDDASQGKRAAVVDRLLASSDYGRNWANYWSDCIGARQQEPELTFHDYGPFKTWLAGEFNAGKGWDEITFEMLTAIGKVGDRPAGTLIAFHQADENKLAGETSRVFLSVQIACAECHDHPFVDMPTETFHGMAAFFVRTDAKIPWNESSQIELVSKDKGEHHVPGQKADMKPTALGGIAGSAEYETGLPDLKRRELLANWIVQPENPFYARAYVNRLFARLMGRGFYEPVDDLGESAEDPILPEVHAALATHFVSTGYDHKEMVRLLANTRIYQRTHTPPQGADSDAPLATAVTKKLRGDEIFDSLASAIDLPNIQPEKAKPTTEIRFPVPPKSTRDLVNEAFGYDPSLKDDLLVRTMKQAMFMMNNTQLQAQIDARPESESYLSKLLQEQQDDAATATRLYRAVLGRTPSEREVKLVADHVAKLGDRGAAFEDVLWGLINSAEFVTRR
ncbi:MAG: DUF1549 domain-containing protein [Planctomycetales bacterium]|nr:DUF1549 domain-containing protein [Planctomycetales bacterium]